MINRQFGAVIASSAHMLQVAADELTFGPLHVATFFSFMTLAQGGSWQVKRLCRIQSLISHLSIGDCNIGLGNCGYT